MDDKEYKTGEPAPGAKRAKLEQQLRRLEVEAYCALISAFRAQGDLTWKKAQLLQDLRQILRVPEERHKMELKRVTDDENLVEIAKLSSSLQFGESELDTTVGDDANRSRAGRKKGTKAPWGDSNKDKALPYLDAVTAPISSQPPSLSKIPPAARDAAKGKAKAKPATPAKPAPAKAATPAKPAAAAAAVNRKRKAPTPTPAPKKAAAGPPTKKRGAKPKTEVKAEDAAEVNMEEPEKVEVEGEEEDEAHIKEVEEQLRAKQEQLMAELAALQAEIEDDDELEEEEEEAINEEGGEEAGNNLESEVAGESVDMTTE